MSEHDEENFLGIGWDAVEAWHQIDDDHPMAAETREALVEAARAAMLLHQERRDREAAAEAERARQREERRCLAAAADLWPRPAPRAAAPARPPAVRVSKAAPKPSVPAAGPSSGARPPVSSVQHPQPRPVQEVRPLVRRREPPVDRRPTALAAATSQEIPTRPAREPSSPVSPPSSAPSGRSLTGADLAAWRSRAGLTQRAAAERLDVAQGTISKAEAKRSAVLGAALSDRLARQLATRR